jgi:hypothetical protein
MASIYHNFAPRKKRIAFLVALGLFGGVSSAIKIPAKSDVMKIASGSVRLAKGSLFRRGKG